LSSRVATIGLAGGAGEQSVVADAMELLRQNVEQEACSAHPGALDTTHAAIERLRPNTGSSPSATSCRRRQRLAFEQRFGGVDLKRFFAAVPGHPMIAEVRTVPGQRRRPDLIKPQTRSA
jgi:hypothetical protein